MARRTYKFDNLTNMSIAARQMTQQLAAAGFFPNEVFDDTGSHFLCSIFQGDTHIAVLEAHEASLGSGILSYTSTSIQSPRVEQIISTIAAEKGGKSVGLRI